MTVPGSGAGLSGIGPRTRVFALLGDPVGHSLSPAMQNAAIRAAGLDAVYVALRCGPAELPGLVAGLARAGGGGNVTLPHKELAAGSVDRPDEVVKRTGACNTFWLDGDEVRGDNTDVEGLRRALAEFLAGGGSPDGGPDEGPEEDPDEGPDEGLDRVLDRVLLLGAGGAARAALAVLGALAGSQVVVHNRTVERARAMVERLGGPGVRVASSLDELHGSRFDLVVNATRLGLDDADPLPLDPQGPVEAERIMDLVYRPGETALVRRARELGILARDGRDMLLHQGAVAFERWWGRPPSLEAMRTALEREAR